MDDRNHDEIVSEQNEKLRIQRNYYRRLHVNDLCILNAEEYYESLKDWSKFKEPRDTSKRDAENILRVYESEGRIDVTKTYIHFNRYDSYKFETPMDTGTGSIIKE